ncbi:hypothetical protein H6F93_02940 [Leptolyngbya sp. FACHB-671]|uniref:hypothetical protein n=1 Tax=Leptolyngbya sp. FACHB-671 TaxID=2692812 RepID=UPI00168A2A8A|nr:hypothetical protein [Leptolyngbya sp. FACHB-671]MBD2066488.1 hypothetical protein [Leptolyngbya sp. FACHB-671]
MYELFQDEEFKHFQLTKIPLQKLLEVDLSSEIRADLTSLAANEKIEVHFTDISEGMHIDLRLSFRSEAASASQTPILPEVTISHRNPQFFVCLETITQLWTASEERLRFLDTTLINKLVERLRPAGNYWLSYFELQPHLDRLAESSNAEVAGLVQKLFDHQHSLPKPYFRYFLGIQGESLIIAPYPIFLGKWATATINPEITEENSLQLNIFTSRSRGYMGFCRKALGLAKDLLDLGATPGEERVRFNIPKVVNKIETHTLAFIQRHTPPFLELVDRIQSMLLDISLYAPQAYAPYLAGYPTEDPLSKLKQRFVHLTPSETTVNILSPIYTALYTQDALMLQYLQEWQALRYPNQQVLDLLLQALQIANQQKQVQLQTHKAKRIQALELMLDTLLKSVQVITQYEVQIIAHQPQSILTTPEIQQKIQLLLMASENMESEWKTILQRLVRQQPPTSS